MLVLTEDVGESTLAWLPSLCALLFSPAPPTTDDGRCRRVAQTSLRLLLLSVGGDLLATCS